MMDGNFRSTRKLGLVLAAGFVAGLLTTGCSVATDAPGGPSAPITVDPRIETEAFRGTPCAVNGVAYPPRYIGRRATQEDPTFDPSGLRIRFPTPWVKPGPSLPDVYRYEHGLNALVPSIGTFPSAHYGVHRFEYRVHDLVPTANGFTTERSNKEWFFVGFNSQNQSAAQTWVDTPGQSFTQPPVSATLGHCFYVMDRTSNGSFVWSGELWTSGDEHDPANHPW